jgi:PAS domain S-box-containing protein
LTKGPGVSVLLVDDRPENLLALEAILEPLGATLVRALSGEEALKHVLKHDFAVILLDVQMPGMNGFETAKLIKSRERSRSIPIIFLTAISKDEAFVFEGYSVGAVDYMFKPFQPDILRSKVAVFIDLFRKQEQLTRQEQLLRESQRRELELQHRAALAESEARLAEIVGSAMDAIITFDESQKINLFNAAAERLFRTKKKAAIGKPVDDLLAPSFRGDHLKSFCADAMARASEGGAGGSTSLDLAGLRADGTEFPLEATVSCLSLPEGKTFTLIGRDVSERHAAEAALRRQAATLAASTAELKTLNEELNIHQAELERAMSARNRFYASMSHELRTPINAIIGYSTLLLDRIYGPLNEKQGRGIERTHKAAKHLQELVNDILDLSKIEAGKMDIQPQEVEFPELVDDLFVTVQPLADGQKSTLTLNHSGPPIKVVSDPRRVRQILLNLLSNAIKFGGGKPINVGVAARDEGGVVIEVTDHGAGIPHDDLVRIFDEFVQLGSRSDGEGTGLGLPISLGLARLLGGKLEAESEVGVGSTFRLTLPARAGRGSSADQPSPMEEAGRS